MEVKYHLNGVEADCNYRKMHINTGTTCDDADLVGGHYWDATDYAADTWHHGAHYNSDANGKAKGAFDIINGYDAAGNLGHVVVIHA